jgi:hypothetical protein
MSLAYIIQQVERKTGMNDSSAAQRAMLLDVINEAAREIYEKRDLPGCLRECYVRASTNKELALPSFIGELRAVRSTLWNDTWKIQDMRPRYHARDWPNQWKMWRVKGNSPIHTELTNTAPGTITIPTADSSLTVTIMGETLQSSRVVNTVTMDATEKSWASSFTNIKLITKNKVNTENITILDADDAEMSVIYADQKEARYTIIDVSTYPDWQNCPENVMEVLYKERLPRMENDYDIFPVDGFDDAIVIKSLQLLTEGQEGKEDRALLMQAKADEIVKRKTEDKTGTFNNKMSFKEQKKFGIFRRRYWNY